ncbi:MAG: hypothetical protein LUE17_06740 [Planctomycetaceae bacterium]|nr:hypothetical protein [Planctomycetaceae bacterium]
MKFTEEQYVALKEAIASGELSVQYNGRRIQYRSLAEMLQAKSLMEDELFGKSKRRRHRAIFKKGL